MYFIARIIGGFWVHPRKQKHSRQLTTLLVISVPPPAGVVGQQQVTRHEGRPTITRKKRPDSHTTPVNQRDVSTFDGHNRHPRERSPEIRSNTTAPSLWADWSKTAITGPGSHVNQQVGIAANRSATAGFLETIPESVEPDIQDAAKYWLLKI